MFPIETAFIRGKHGRSGEAVANWLLIVMASPGNK